jgi:hypothetical protein
MTRRAQSGTTRVFICEEQAQRHVQVGNIGPVGAVMPIGSTGGICKADSAAR